MRVFISYAHDHPEHEALVRELWVFLRACGIDARLDLAAAQDRVDWAAWMTREARDADRVLVIASPAYKRRAEGDAGPDEGRGVQFEARLIRDLFYADQDAGIHRFVPVVLPGGSAGDIPLWLAPASASHYRVSEFTVAGADSLLRMLTGQPAVLVPELGPVPVLPPPTRPTPNGSGSCPLPTTSWGMWRWWPVTWLRRGPLTRRAWTSGPGWSRPIRPTLAGSATWNVCSKRSAALIDQNVN